MNISQLLENISYKEIIGSLDKHIEFISQDSRDASFQNGLYFAISGTKVDGHDYVTDVIEKGALVIICERLPININDTVTYVVVDSSKKIMGEITANFYDNPSKKIKVISVTGTNGKTTVATYAYQALQMLGEKVLLLSTAGDYFNGTKISISRKAPSSLEIIELHRVISLYIDQGATYVCLEATSQGLDQDRLSGVDIDVAIFTNLEQDHLDYHKTIEHYAASKKLLFDNLKNTALAISNYDDSFGKKIISNTSAKIISYGQETTNDYLFTIDNVELGLIKVNINNVPCILPVIGLFNVYNVLSVYATLSELGYDLESVVAVLEKLQGVPGRMQQIKNERGILTLVDYAHSSGALENVLQTLQEIPHNNIISVVGCGGDRDRVKRPSMAKITQSHSDVAIYTADNPRTEDLQQIFKDMKQGVDDSKDNHIFINNRDEAIKHAIEIAKEEDIILIAGKGHEDYQIIGTKKIHFDDKEVADKYLNN